MQLDKEIAQQMARVEALQKEIFARKPSSDDVKRPDTLRKERAQTLRRTITDLQKRRDETVARFDAEIKSYEAELKTLEKEGKVDIGSIKRTTTPKTGRTKAGKS